MFHPGTDENDPFLLTAAGQLGIFCQEPIAWMDGIHLMFFADPDDVFDIQISIHRFFPFSHQIGFICPAAVQRQDIFLGIDGNGTDAQFMTGPENPDSDFPSVGDQDLVDGAHRSSSF